MKTEQKLTISHIQHYLAYGLKVKLSRKGILNLDEEFPQAHNEICEITNLVKCNDNWDVEISSDKDYSYGLIELDEITPLLLPLSALYEEIDGEIGIVEIARTMGLKFKRYELGTSCVDLYLTDRKDKKSRFWYDGFKTGTFCLTIYGYGKVNQLVGFAYLFSHHYDVYDLCSKGLAIDKRSVK